MNTAATELPTAWLLARSSGLLAYTMLTLAVLAGLTLRGRLLGRTVPPALVTAVHRTLSVAGLIAVGLHAFLIAIDTKVDVPLLAVFVPGMAGYRPLATGLGVLAMELWLVIHLSFRLRRRIGVSRWRKLHYVTFAVWGMAAAHGILAGSDSAVPWVRDAYAVSIGLVLLLVAFRSSGGARRKRAPAAPRPNAAPQPVAPSPPASVPEQIEHPTRPLEQAS